MDIVVNQVLLSIPMCVQYKKETKESLLVTHASTSSINPVVWREVVQYLVSYHHRSPYQSRVFNPKVSFYQNQKLYKVTSCII